MRRLLLIGAVLVGSGCSGKISVEAGRAFYIFIDRPHRAYVDADANLSDLDKAIRIQALDSFDRLLTEAEK